MLIVRLWGNARGLNKEVLLSFKSFILENAILIIVLFLNFNYHIGCHLNNVLIYLEIENLSFFFHFIQSNIVAVHRVTVYISGVSSEVWSTLTWIPVIIISINIFFFSFAYVMGS